MKRCTVNTRTKQRSAHSIKTRLITIYFIVCVFIVIRIIIILIVVYDDVSSPGSSCSLSLSLSLPFASSGVFYFNYINMLGLNYKVALFLDII